MSVQSISTLSLQRTLDQVASQTPSELPRDLIDGFGAALARHDPTASVERVVSQPWYRADEPPSDPILSGIEHLRRVFDAQEQAVVRRLQPAVTDMDALVSVQVDLAKYSLLIDVTSKMTGKLTQTLDTLMKGQ